MLDARPRQTRRKKGAQPSRRLAGSRRPHQLACTHRSPLAVVPASVRGSPASPPPRSCRLPLAGLHPRLAGIATSALTPAFARRPRCFASVFRRTASARGSRAGHAASPPFAVARPPPGLRHASLPPCARQLPLAAVLSDTKLAPLPTPSSRDHTLPSLAAAATVERLLRLRQPPCVLLPLLSSTHRRGLQDSNCSASRGPVREAQLLRRSHAAGEDAWRRRRRRSCI